MKPIELIPIPFGIILEILPYAHYMLRDPVESSPLTI